jgi:serine/threonine protein kinase
VTQPPAPDRYEPGALVGAKYRLERKLGEGGMGSVWSAHHVGLDTAVAIKLIRGESNREDLGVRLLQEARAAAKLGHPAIVRVFDVGQTSDGTPFIVMELLEGESLNQRLDRESRLPATEAVQLLLPIADALRAAHGKGIVHRDIKPDNVFLVHDDTGVQPKLVDFGIAKLEQRDPDTQLTGRGVILGSPDYMAPEQARGEESIDHRADVWSFCVLLYEVVSGHAPFDGANYNALLRAIVETTPPSLEALRAADAELSAVVARGMAKQPSDRWQSMLELGEELARWLLKQGVFEDAAGGSIEAKWVLRRSDPAATRQSRSSFASLHDGPSASPALGPVRPHATTERRFELEEPASLGAVVTGVDRRGRQRALYAVVGAAAVLVVIVLFGLRSRRPVVEASRPAAQALPTSAHSAPVLVPTETPRARDAALAPASSSIPKPGRSRARPTKPVPSARPADKSGLDLMTPY